MSLKVIRLFEVVSMACAMSEEYENGGRLRERLVGFSASSGETGMKDSDTKCCLSCSCCRSLVYCLTEFTLG